MGEFYERRMELLQVTKEKNTLRLYNPEAQSPAPKWVETSIFREDRGGNIEIGYWDLDSQLIVYYNDNKTPSPRFYRTVRLANPTSGEGKYRMPKGQGTFPWLHPSLLEKFKTKTPIDTLVLTEGAFKAWEACERGIDTVGLSSITHYADHSGQLYRDVARLIDECHVQNVVICWDGDCRDISEKSLAVREELTKRPAGFFNSAKKIRKLVLEYPYTRPDRPSVWFYHVLSESFDDHPKGLDDLLISARATAKVGDVVTDCLALEKKSRHFFKMDITNSHARLHEYFGLKDANLFYMLHSREIGEKEFYWNGDLLIYNSEKNQLEQIAPGWAADCRWIGDEFFMERLMPGAKGDRRVLLKRTKETMKDLHGKDFQKHLKFFDGFCNVPDHWNYEQVIDRGGRQFYNRYFPFRWVPEPGDFGKILGFVKHIFGEHPVAHSVTGEKYPAYELGLDYIQLLLQQPTQALPVVCLYSAENNTGKSTWGKLLAAIFGDNVVQIGNADLQSDFNETYSDKLLAICEETLLERKRDVERIKALSTSESVLVNPKGQKQFVIDFFCKFQFYSNNIRMIYVTRHDERFWIIKVPRAKADNPNLLNEMREQVPGFLQHLKTRELATKRESRMWFHPSLIKTETFQEVVEVNEPTDATDLRENISEMFIQLDDQAQEIRMPLGNIKEEFFGPKTSSKWIQEILRDYLQVDLAREGDVALFERGHYTKFVADPDLGMREVRINWRGRPYVFPRSKFHKEVLNIEKRAEQAAATAVSEEWETEKLPF